MGFGLGLLLILGLLCYSKTAALDAVSPTLQGLSAVIYQVDERNTIIKTIEDKANSDVIIENIDRIRLECNAPFPVQWIYTGTGVPLLLSTIRKESSNRFSASAFITSLKEEHTGKYECGSTELPYAVNTYFFVYVPGPNIFTANGGKTIYIPKNDTHIRIPCSVSNPKVSVLLERSVGDVLIPIKTPKKPTPFKYDPKFGFDLDLKDITNPEGTYVCTAIDQGARKTVEYIVTYPANRPVYPSDIVGDDPSKYNDGIKCETHTDCPPNWSCYTDLTCKDPCLHSIRCGKGAICKYNERRPYCECPKDFVGDAMAECFNTLQGSDSGVDNRSRPRPDSEQTTRQSTQCKVNQQCSRNQICLTGQCIDPCSVKICDKNAYCVTDESRVAMCICNPGFTGQNGRECTPVKLTVEPIRSPSGEKLIQGSGQAKGACEAGACGPNSECKLLFEDHVDCKCNEGYIGYPPKCTAACEHNRDCPADTICKTTGAYPACIEICGPKMCGVNAECVTKNGTIDLFIKEESKACYCKDDFTGNPYVQCDPIQEGKDCRVDNDCQSRERCRTASTYRKCVDPCDQHRCPHTTECLTVNHIPTCICPVGYTGSPALGCTKDVSIPVQQFSSSIPVQEFSSSIFVGKTCANKVCGPFSECRIVDGEPTCFCQSNYVGEPPNCKQECVTNLECPPEKTCVQNRCRNACRNKCGKNARCRVTPGILRQTVCSCRQGYSGDPNVDCAPIREH